MITSSEAAQIKNVTESARDRKYCLVAYSRLLTDFGTQMPREATISLISALIDAACPTNKANTISSLAQKSVEE